ncbi:hypothetical protein EVG20_g7583 [Dentipellis fragilis]|uniref:Zinc finger Sec23/Sec24-type domain-containing protein n=1 Tax=Dentipellis fragilis TaxID=205917 RepID=A0A4Y9YCT6_9AGAM|nr:hypothetical protein EVG20_g7583 [Dentipellis fragilis]
MGLRAVHDPHRHPPAPLHIRLRRHRPGKRLSQVHPSLHLGLPHSSRLANELDIPLFVVLQPFAELDPRDEPVPVVNFGPDGPPRCDQCKGYVNPWCTWIAEGWRWMCNLCGHASEVGANYYSPLDPHLLRVDQPNRLELQKGTVDFVVSDASEYWEVQPPTRLAPSYILPPAPPLLPSSSPSPPTSPPRSSTSAPSTPMTPSGFMALQTAPPPDTRKPTPMPHLFALDVSQTSVVSGFFRSSCDAILLSLYGGIDQDGNTIAPSLPEGCSVGILTFDNSLHFYDLSPHLESARVLIVSDIDEPFIPLRTGLFVDPHESRSVLEQLLQSLPARHEGTLVSQTCLGSVLSVTLAALTRLGGHLIVFQATRPTLGPGALLESPSLTSSSDPDHPITIHDPDAAWENAGEDSQKPASA